MCAACFRHVSTSLHPPCPPTSLPPAAPADAAARLAQRDGQPDFHLKRKLQGRREGTVLDPCRLALDFVLEGGGAEGSPGAYNCTLHFVPAGSPAVWALPHHFY